ncbi:hypothetical protein [Massilia sp. CF038]|uniref:hypothetical protein n=1 Tax=Massilia sp. CF038 TaxID=1881045 RepID=UPI0009155931|nr:hypothetical protein [Massilia sp. CF038]SHH62636.1 hypothetical protein SAMN05428948_4697 [Massilia sp. CF038]
MTTFDVSKISIRADGTVELDNDDLITLENSDYAQIAGAIGSSNALTNSYCSNTRCDGTTNLISCRNTRSCVGSANTRCSMQEQ